jgi:hypothetical protein
MRPAGRQGGQNVNADQRSSEDPFKRLRAVWLELSEAAEILSRWARIAYFSFLAWLVVVFLLAAADLPLVAAAVLFAGWPILGFVKGLSLPMALLPALEASKRKNLIADIITSYRKTVMTAGAFAYTIGNDVDGIWRFGLNHPFLTQAFIVCTMFALLFRLGGWRDRIFKPSAFLLGTVINYLDWRNEAWKEIVGLVDLGKSVVHALVR